MENTKNKKEVWVKPIVKSLSVKKITESAGTQNNENATKGLQPMS